MEGPGSPPFGGSDGVVCFLFSQPREVLPQRGHGLRGLISSAGGSRQCGLAPLSNLRQTHRPGAHTTTPGWGQSCSLLSPSLSPKKVGICRQMTARDSDSRPLGAAMGSSAFFLRPREVLPQRGHGVRRLLGGRRQTPTKSLRTAEGGRDFHIEVRPIQEARRRSERHRPMSALSSARPSRHAVGYLIAIGSSVSGTWFCALTSFPRERRCKSGAFVVSAPQM